MHLKHNRSSVFATEFGHPSAFVVAAENPRAFTLLGALGSSLSSTDDPLLPPHFCLPPKVKGKEKSKGKAGAKKSGMKRKKEDDEHDEEAMKSIMMSKKQKRLHGR